MTAEEKCHAPPPWMSATFQRMVGSTYHRCRLDVGHGGLHVNCEGQTWPIPSTEPTP